MHFGTLADLLPTVNFAARTNVGPVTFGYRRIPDYQMFYVATGSAWLDTGGESFAIGPGEAVLYGSECVHHLRTLSETLYYSMHFEWRAASAIPVHPAHRIVMYDRFPPNDGELRAFRLAVPGYGDVTLPRRMPGTTLEPLLAQIVREYTLEQPGYELALRGALMQLLAAVARYAASERRRQPSGSRIEPALRLMREEPGRSLSVAELAALCGYHPIHFSKLFKEEIGRTPKQYLISVRIALAKRALLAGEQIESIARRLGYASVHYFSNNFKSETGLAPTDFRQQGDPLLRDKGTGGDGDPV